MPDLRKYQKSDLDQALSPQHVSLLRMVADMAAIRRLPLYLVGGFVRDLLLGIPPSDFDLVVEGDAIAFARSLAGKYGGKITPHAHFGTAIWNLDGELLASLQVLSRDPKEAQPANLRTLDIISARSETYYSHGALPTVNLGTLKDDLARRDFTINTLALRLDGDHWGELRDDLGGLDDLKRGLVRVLHPDSFQDDPTRLFRAVRYEQRYDFRIFPETKALALQAKSLIPLLSAQRIRHELDLILEEQNASAMLKRLSEMDLLQPVHPELTWNDAIRQRFLNAFRRLPEYPFRPNPFFSDRSFLGWHFWLMTVTSTDLESLNRRLHFHAKLFESLLAASALSAELPALIGLKPSQWVRRLENLPLTAVYVVFLATPDEKARQNLDKYMETWRHVKPKTNGHDLIKRGLPAGPRFQQVLWRLREAWLDEEVKTENEELDLLALLTKVV
jgi:tRNA nucleotidyltransferase (CCA-adding enzyme)